MMSGCDQSSPLFESGVLKKEQGCGLGQALVGAVAGEHNSLLLRCVRVKFEGNSGAFGRSLGGSILKAMVIGMEL
jgi:hypothetical protein